MSPTIHCVRHAQGYHNLSKENENLYRDPDLTDRGREQCERLSKNFPYHDQIDCLMASPIRRTIQTALRAFKPAIEKGDLQVLLVPRAQETSSKPSDTGSSVMALKEEFGDKINTERMTDDWNSNKGEWAMDSVSIETHVIELRKLIKGFEYANVVLVAHGGFLHYFTEDWSDCPGVEGETGWANTEFRTYEFLEGDGAHLKETAASRERRVNTPAGGFLNANGASNEQ